MDIYVLILPLLVGWILDKLLGDPVGLPHPVVGFGVQDVQARFLGHAHAVVRHAHDNVVAFHLARHAQPNPRIVE